MYQIFAESGSVLLCKFNCRFTFLRLSAQVGTGAKEQFEALWLVIEGAVMEGRVPVYRGRLQVRRILNEEVDDV